MPRVYRDQQDIQGCTVIVFKREKASARASSDRFLSFPVNLPLSLISSYIQNLLIKYKIQATILKF